MEQSAVHASRVEAIRGMMVRNGWDAVIITSSDPHSSEYPADRWKQVRWVSGFGGECGDIVITADHAGLWTDTRYFIAAAQALSGTGIELHKTRVPDQVLIPEWLADRMRAKQRAVIAVDGLCIGADAVREIRDAVSGCVIESVPDMLSELWTDRPEIPCTPVCCVDHGESRREKISWLRQTCARSGCDGILLTALDEIAWTLNVRASDIEYNPLVISNLLISQNSAVWMLRGDIQQADPITSDTVAAVEADGVTVVPYGLTESYVKDFSGTLMIDPSTLSHQLFLSLATVRTSAAESPVRLRKAVKSSCETEGMRRAHLIDGLAVERFLYWLEKSIQEGSVITEWDAAVRLGELRAENEDYRGDSFETISAYGAGAALPHYVTPRENAPVILPHGLYLCDSGGQYSFGTTDITRTVPMGPCTPLEREDYTLVLKCHIDLEMAVWPQGTPGSRLDVLVREGLWRRHRNFGHGSGHGVGCFLCVHEGPHELRQNMNSVPLQAGMILTDEPGIYREGMHGVRHENQLTVVDDGENEFGKWLRFESLTLCHIDTSCIEPGILNADEICWLNAYNASVYSALAGHLSPDEAEWLRAKTAPIQQ